MQIYENIRTLKRQLLPDERVILLGSQAIPPCLNCDFI